jgi:hypothetical protein
MARSTTLLDNEIEKLSSLGRPLWQRGWGDSKIDFLGSPIPALRFISLPLRRTTCTPRGTRFARLDLGLFTKSSMRMTFYEFIKAKGAPE